MSQSSRLKSDMKNTKNKTSQMAQQMSTRTRKTKTWMTILISILEAEAAATIMISKLTMSLTDLALRKMGKLVLSLFNSYTSPQIRSLTLVK